MAISNSSTTDYNQTYGKIPLYEYYMFKKIMVFITGILTLGFIILLPVFITTKNGIIEIITISVGVTLYHFAMRLTVGIIINYFMKNQANYNNLWFREKRGESGLYKSIRVHK